MQKNQSVANVALEKSKVELSVVVPVFNEEKNVAAFCDELITVLKKLGMVYEVFLINVPGRDNSYSVINNLGKKYKRVYPINMYYLHTKGYQKAYQYMLGFKCAKGKYVVQMDSDYQDDPKDLPKFLVKLDEGFDLVVGWKQKRKDPFFYKLTSKAQNIVTRIVTGVHVHDKNCGYKAYSRRAVDSLSLYGMNYRDIPMQLAAKEFKITEIPIANRRRISGKSNFTFFNRLLGGTVDFLSAFLISMTMDKPFRIWGGLGILLFLFGIGELIAILLWSVFTNDNTVTLHMILAVVIGVICIVKGVMFFGIGIITEYQRSLQPFFISEYEILDDPKKVIGKIL